MKRVWAVALFALFATPAILAQDAQSDDITFSGTETTIPFSGTSTLMFDATMSCESFLEIQAVRQSPAAEQAHDVAISPPAGFSSDAMVEITFDGTPCIEGANPSASISVEGAQFNITPGNGAPGKVKLEVNVTSGESSGLIPFQVEYRRGYTFNVNQQFPVEVRMDEEGNWMPVTFTADVVVTANADTMVMMQVDDGTEYGNLAGLFANSPKNFFLTPAEIESGVTLTLEFTYQPTVPAEGWTEDTITFTTWGHWMDDGSLKEEHQVTWTFVNGEALADGNGSNGTPGFGPAAALLALVAVALLIRRNN